MDPTLFMNSAKTRVPLGASVSLCVIGAWQLLTRQRQPRNRRQPGFLRSVFWPVLALGAIAVGSATVAMMQSFGSFRGPAQIINGISSFLVPLVFVVLLIRWMWLTLGAKRPGLFWALTAGLILLIACAVSGLTSPWPTI